MTLTTLIPSIVESCSIDSDDHIDGLLPTDASSQLRGLAGQLRQSVCATDQNLGHLEEELLRGCQEVMRQMLEKAAQQKADEAPLCRIARTNSAESRPGTGRPFKPLWRRRSATRARLL